MIRVQETDIYEINEARYRWLNDSDIDRYIGFSDEVKLNDSQKIDKENERHFEIFDDDELVGDIRFIYNSDDDKQMRRAEFIIIIGKRNAGIGSKSFPVIMNAVKSIFNSIYCYIHKSNFRSVKLMKKNGFYVEDIKGSELLLVKDLDDE